MNTINKAQTILRSIRTQTLAEIDGSEDGAVTRYWADNNRIDATIYVELVVFGVDSMWTVGPVIFDDGRKVDEQYAVESIDEATKLLAEALKI